MTMVMTTCIENFLSVSLYIYLVFFFSSRRRHTRCSRDWSSDVCSSDLEGVNLAQRLDGFGIPKKHTELRAASARDHDRDRCGQPQGAGACDNQHRDRIDERISQTRFGSEDPPGYKSEQRDQDDGRDKPSRNSSGQSL